jgi:hypothetical protein
MNLQSTLRECIAYEIGARGETFNPAVIMDTQRQLNAYYSTRDLRLMITDECVTFPGISEAITAILSETYSDSATVANGTILSLSFYDPATDDLLLSSLKREDSFLSICSPDVCIKLTAAQLRNILPKLILFYKKGIKYEKITNPKYRVGDKVSVLILNKGTAHGTITKYESIDELHYRVTDEFGYSGWFNESELTQI